jgi:hypothetical protein
MLATSIRFVRRVIAGHAERVEPVVEVVEAIELGPFELVAVEQRLELEEFVVLLVGKRVRQPPLLVRVARIDPRVVLTANAERPQLVVQLQKAVEFRIVLGEQAGFPLRDQPGVLSEFIVGQCQLVIPLVADVVVQAWQRCVERPFHGVDDRLGEFSQVFRQAHDGCDLGETEFAHALEPV